MSNVIVYALVMIAIILAGAFCVVKMLMGNLKYIIVGLFVLGLFAVEADYGAGILNEGAKRRLTMIEAFDNEEIHEIVANDIYNKLDEVANRGDFSKK